MMKTFVRHPEGDHSHLFCGHWNGSPLEIGLQIEPLREIPTREVHHSHDYHEYYVVIHGEATIHVNGEDVQLLPGKTIMIEPGEAHSITWIHPTKGCQWVLVKERSEPNSKKVEEFDSRA